MLTDPFSPNAFKMQELTAAMNNMPYVPGQISRLGVYQERGVSTTTIILEEKNSVISVVSIKPRGAPPNMVPQGDRKVRSFVVPHIPATDTIMADEVQGVRSFGSDSNAEAVQEVVNEKLADMRVNIDYTMEAHRMQNLLGNFYDATGSAVSLFTTFGVTEQSVDFVLGTATTEIRVKCAEVIRKVEAALGGLSYSGLQAVCDDAFWDKLIAHDAIKETYLNTASVVEIRGNPMDSFNFGGITWVRYRGDSNVDIATGEARVIPMGVQNLFITRFAPADYMETVNTRGIPYYVKSEPLPMNKGVVLEAQSNPINLCTRPKAIIKLTTSN